MFEPETGDRKNYDNRAAEEDSIWLSESAISELAEIEIPKSISQSKNENLLAQAENGSDLDIPLGLMGLTIADVFTRENSSQDKKQNSFQAVDGGAWKKENNNWSYYDKDGNKQEKYKDVVDVNSDDAGNIHIKFKEGSCIEKTDGSKLFLNANNQITELHYPDGRVTKIAWDGNEIKSVLFPDGVEWVHTKDGDNYKDYWTNNKQFFAGKIEVDSSTGILSMQYMGKTRNGDTEKYFTDLSRETVHADKSHDTRLPNALEISYDPNDNITKMKYPDGTIRQFGWKYNEENKEYTLNKVTLNRTDGNTYVHALQKDGWYCNGQKEQKEFFLDSKTAKYGYVDKDTGYKFIKRVDPGYDVYKPNGDSFQIDQNERIIRAQVGDKVRECSYASANATSPNEIRDLASGLTWKLEGDTWVSNKGEKIKGQPKFSDNGDYSFVSKDSSIEFPMNGPKREKSTIKVDGATIEKTVTDNAYGEIKITQADGSQRIYTAMNAEEGKRVISDTRIRNGKTETWARQKKENSDEYSDVWMKDGSGETETRLHPFVSKEGKFSYQCPDGKTYFAAANGSEQIANEKENWKVDLKNGKTAHIQLYTGAGYDVRWDGEVVKSYDIETEDGKIHTWNRIGKGKYECDGDISKFFIDFAPNGTAALDFGNGNKRVVSPGGYVMSHTASDNKTVETYRGQLLRMSVGDAERRVERGDQGQAVSILDSKDKIVYKRDGNNWNVFDLEGNPIIDGIARYGEPAFNNKNGDMHFWGDGNSIHIDGFAGPDLHLTTGHHLEKLISEQGELNVGARTQVVLCLEALNIRTDITQKQKDDTLAQVERILNDDGNTLHNASDRAVLAAQLLWHVSQSNLDSQGDHGTCNVSDIRLCLQYENPDLFAKVMADMIVDHEYTTVDKSKITLPDDSVERTAYKVKGDDSFPPLDGCRTWIGRIWDLTAANIHWQRAISTPSGQQVNKGSLYYRQDAPDCRGDVSEGVYLRNQKGGGEAQYKNGKKVDYPNISPDGIIDIYQQITGKKETDRFLLHNTVKFAKNRISGFADEKALHTLLSKGPWPKIIHIETSAEPFWTDGGSRYTVNGTDGPGHVVVITKYDPQTKKAYIDNTWSPSADHLDPNKPAKQGGPIDLAMLYRASYEKVKRSEPAEASAVQAQNKKRGGR